MAFGRHPPVCGWCAKETMSRERRRRLVLHVSKANASWRYNVPGIPGYFSNTSNDMRGTQRPGASAAGKISWAVVGPPKCQQAKANLAASAERCLARDYRTSNFFAHTRFMNRIIREVGPINERVPEFPLASGALVPLRAKTQALGSDDFSSTWAGEAAALGRELPAFELTQTLAEEAQNLLRNLTPSEANICF